MELLQLYREHKFVESDEFLFDAADDIIYYSATELPTPQGKVALLHEVAHAQLNHFDYSSDLELVMMECRAWQRTRWLARRHNLSIDESYVADCLHGYADWLQERATCPQCRNFSLQTTRGIYQCFRCKQKWLITTDPFNRNQQETIT